MVVAADSAWSEQVHELARLVLQLDVIREEKA